MLSCADLTSRTPASLFAEPHKVGLINDMEAFQADLLDPTSLPAALVGIHTVIDCATARPEESTERIDWDGKVALIQCAQVGNSRLS